MQNNKLLNELDDEEISDLMKYSIPFSKENDVNIKSKFLEKANLKKKKFSIKKLFIPTLAATFLLSTLIYGGVIDLNKIYEKVFGDNAQYMSQYGLIIDGGNEFDGIKLNLVSTIKEEQKLFVFFTLTDTTGDRLSETMDLHDSWRLDQGGGGRCELLFYDKNTKTASFMITSVGASTNKTATLKITSFLKSLEFRENLKENTILLSNIVDNTPQTFNFSEYENEGYGSGISDASKYNDEEMFKKLKLLKEDNMSIPFSNINWSIISNIGFVDGELHIKTKPYENIFSSIMSISFIDKDNNQIYTNEFSISYGENQEKAIDGHGKYNEFIFENINNISQLNDLTLVLDVAEYGDYYKGEWSATFKVPKQVNKITIPTSKKIKLSGEEITIDKMVLSPLGLTIEYESNTTEELKKNADEAYVTYLDGTVVYFLSRSRGFDMDKHSFNFSEPIIEIEKVKSVNVNGEEFVISK